jgi:hypothetical protein
MYVCMYIDRERDIDIYLFMLIQGRKEGRKEGRTEHIYIFIYMCVEDGCIYKYSITCVYNILYIYMCAYNILYLLYICMCIR